MQAVSRGVKGNVPLLERDQCDRVLPFDETRQLLAFRRFEQPLSALETVDHEGAQLVGCFESGGQLA